MTKIIPLGARAFPSLIAGFSMLGCYAEPYCAVNGVVDGSFSGQIAWRGAGEGDCSLGEFGELEVGTGPERIAISSEDYIGVPLTVIGQYPAMHVDFYSGGNEWSADGCQVGIVSVVREDWTKSDYLYITGTLTCPPLQSDDVASISLVGVAFTGYFIEGGGLF